MPENSERVDVQLTAKRVQELIDKVGGLGAIIGGIALGFHADYRGTRDVDAILSGFSVTPEQVVSEAEPIGIVPRVEDIVADARTILVMRFIDSASGIPIDLSLA